MEPIAGVITTPTLRPDGSVLSTPGYDRATRLYLIEDKTLKLPPIPDKPTREQAAEALDLLKGLLPGFPFKTDASRAVALSGIITAVVRGAMNVAPLHVVRAHTRGTGKSFLVDLVSTVSAGRPCPVITAGKTEEETEKRLGALLKEGVPLVSIDNCNGELGGSALCTMITQPVMRVRILGKSEAPEFDNRATVFATGNNLRLVGDMTRRAILCDLDANMEKPEKRSFKFDPIEYVASRRGDYIAAAIIIVRAYQTAGCPTPCSPLAGFEDWSRLVRAPLVWLGEADAAETMDLAQDEDPERAAIIEVFQQWKATMPKGRLYASAQVLAKANERDAIGREYANPGLHAALLAVAGAGGAINSLVLGRYLAGISGRIVGGMKLQKQDHSSKPPRYSLETIEAAEDGEPRGRRADRDAPPF
jgi:putative DNA primase/helicase